MHYYALILFAVIVACGESPLESEVDRLSEQVAYLSALVDEESNTKQDATQHLWELDGTWVRLGFGDFDISYDVTLAGVLVDTLYIARTAEATYEYRLWRTVVEGEVAVQNPPRRGNNDLVYQDEIADYFESYSSYYESPKLWEERGEMVVRNGEAIIQWLERDDPRHDWEKEEDGEEIAAWDKRPRRAHIRWHRDYLVLNYRSGGFPDWPHEWWRTN